MVKLQGPCLSLEASGQLGGAIVFSKWKGRPYARALVKPANPKSGGQVGVRAMFKFLSQNWAALSSGLKASWETRADQTVISPFNAYMSLNQERWRNFLGPTQQDPALENLTNDVITNEAALAGERQITVSGDVANVETNNWGVVIFRSLSAIFTTTWDKAIAIIFVESGISFLFVDSPLVPDTYYYNFRPFTAAGDLGAEETEVNATVT